MQSDHVSTPIPQIWCQVMGNAFIHVTEIIIRKSDQKPRNFKKANNFTYIPVLIFTVKGLDMTSVIDLIITSRGFFLHISPLPIPRLYTRSVK